MDSATMKHATCRHRAVGAVALRQRGAVAIIVALSMVVLLGFAGLVLDLGRLYINKTELQSAADACALAAANELVCDPTAGACPTQFLTNAENAGIFVARRNKLDFQGSAVVIAPTDVKFSTTFTPNSGYLTKGSASVDSKFAMCIAHSKGLLPWFMGVLGIGASDVASIAVATLAPSDAFCDPAPMGICATGPAPTFGLTENQWLRSDFTESGTNDSLTGSFRWVDYSPPAGGTPDLRDILAGTTHFCGVRVGDDVRENGVHQGTKFAYNTRFGLYSGGGGPNAYTPANAPPDKSGYAYPTKHPPATPGFDYNEAANGLPPAQLSAFADYQSKHSVPAGTRYEKNDYPPPNPPNPSTVTFKAPPNENSATGYASGVQRRLIMTPIISCAGNVKPIVAMGCSLMLNPMGNGNSSLFLEYLGLATTPGSPCRTAGLPAGSGGNGPMVPTLVQ